MKRKKNTNNNNIYELKNQAKKEKKQFQFWLVDTIRALFAV